MHVGSRKGRKQPLLPQSADFEMDTLPAPMNLD
jgi:hypothetical protein